MGRKARAETYGFDKQAVNRLQKCWTKTLSREGTVWDFDTFLRWTRDSGYEYGMKLCLIDESKPYSAENASWRDTGFTQKAWCNQEKLAKEWEDMMQPIRTRMGLQRKAPCESCPDAKECDTICEARARHWDRSMERLRERLGG